MAIASFLNDEFIQWLAQENPDYERARAAIIVAYNQETNSNLDPFGAKDDVQLIAVVAWLNRLETNDIETGFWARRPKLTRLFSTCISSKINYLAQHHCDLCRCDFPIETIPIRIRPRSHQAATPAIKVAFKKAIAQRLGNSHNYAKARLCIHIVVACGRSSRTGDLDNVAKLLLDAMKGTVFDDDCQVDHLSILRVRDAGEEDYIYLHIGRSTLNDHRDMVFVGTHHSWAGQPPVNLDDFFEAEQQESPL